jgi:hypothetical protein
MKTANRAKWLLERGLKVRVSAPGKRVKEKRRGSLFLTCSNEDGEREAENEGERK